jgi:hypothetical protein
MLKTMREPVLITNPFTPIRDFAATIKAGISLIVAIKGSSDSSVLRLRQEVKRRKEKGNTVHGRG